MDPVVGFVLVAAFAASCVIIGIVATARGAGEKRRIDHEEHMAGLEPMHRESMAKIAANRDAEIAKATHKAPVPVIDNASGRRIE